MRESESAAAGKSAKAGEKAEWERQQEVDRADEESRCGFQDKYNMVFVESSLRMMR